MLHDCPVADGDSLAKSLSTFFNPVGKVCVPVAVMDELERRKAEKEVDAYLNK